MDLARKAAAVAEWVRLVEQVLLDAVQEQAAAELKRADRLALPAAAVVWRQDGSASINGRSYEGREGEFQLVDQGAAQVLVDSGVALLREPLTLPPAQRPEVAAELRSIARELQRAADVLDPPARRTRAKRQATKRRGA